MDLGRRALISAACGGAAVATALGPIARPRAQAADTIRIGLLTDMSGPYRDLDGPLAVKAVAQAVEDFAKAGGTLKVEVVSADHQNKPDVGAGIVRKWYDQDGVDFVTGIPNSAVALAVAGVTRQKNKAYANTGAATSDLTGKQCNANTIHWTYDTWMLGKSTGGAAVRAGGDTWFFITADYNFGHSLQRDTTTFVQAGGGKVLGSVAYPFPGTTDFSSFLLQAQASGAKVIGLANAGADTVNSIKQAHEFGITQQLAGLLVFIPDIHALTLEVAHGLLVTETFYWDLNDRTRALSARMRRREPDKRLDMGQAGAYSAALHYLKTAAAMGPAEAKKDGAATVARMKAMPTDDDAFGPGRIRQDGRKLHPAYLFEVKTPAESKGPWDYYKLIATTPADQAFRPLDQGGCPLVKT
jgi:branched-chain amino acid transport system substrate-binding protein